MTASQTRTIAHITAALESDRAAAELNARPILSLREQAQSLAVAMLAAKDAGELSRARELATLLKPLMNYLD